MAVGFWTLPVTMIPSSNFPKLPPDKLLNLILTNAPVVIYAIDANGILILAEGKGLATLETGLCQAIGQSVFELYSDYPDIIANIQACLNGQQKHWYSYLEQATYSNYAFPLNSLSGEITGLIAVATDITELHQTLQEKEFLLKEIHHRVKNNLQIISSLLDLQEEKFELENVSTKIIIFNIKQRIKSLALIHEQLYLTPFTSQINFQEYISTLVKNLVAAYQLNPKTFTIEVTGDPVVLDVDTVTSCGLLVNEIITHALRSAFSNQTIENKLSVRIASSQTSVILTIKDNGCCLAESINLENPSTLALQLVQVLARQLDGRIELNRTQGTEFSLIFPLPQAKKFVP